MRPIGETSLWHVEDALLGQTSVLRAHNSQLIATLIIMVKRRKYKEFNLRFYKELVFSFLALLSVVMVGIEHFYQLEASTVARIGQIDVIIALIFLADFILTMLKSKNKLKYTKNNWYLLLASIPVVEGWAEILRGLRLLELVRLIRAGEHLSYAIQEYKNGH